jgi:hypothetical protein
MQTDGGHSLAGTVDPVQSRINSNTRRGGQDKEVF